MICNLQNNIHFRAPILCKDKVVLKEGSRPTVLLTALAVLSSITACVQHVYKFTTPTIFNVIITTILNLFKKFIILVN